MGVTHGDLRKKNKSSSTIMKQGKKNVNRDDQNRRITFGKNQSQMTKDLKNEYETTENKPQSKTDKTIDDTKKIEEDIKNKSHLDTIKNLKCLSTDKLLKIENHNFNNNHEENLPNSYETNFSSTKSNEDLANKLLYDDLYNGLDDNNSIDEEDEDENEENEEKQNEEEKEKNVMLITNNIKAVFVDSKLNGKEQKTEDKNKEQEEKQKENKEIKNPNDIPRVSSETSITSSTFDYELNFYRNGNDIRQSYISKLISKNVWIPNMKPKQHNSLIIFDWDDTLLPTSFLTPGECSMRI